MGIVVKLYFYSYCCWGTINIGSAVVKTIEKPGFYSDGNSRSITHCGYMRGYMEIINIYILLLRNLIYFFDPVETNHFILLIIFLIQLKMLKMI